MLIAAVDIGTSSTRALLFDDARFTDQSAAVEYALKSPEPGAAELDALEVMSAAVKCIHDLTQAASAPIECVTLSAAMHSLLAVDARGLPLTAVFTWADNRAAPIQAKAAEWLHGTTLAPSGADAKTLAPSGAPDNTLAPSGAPATISARSLYLETGVPFHPMSPLLKLAWLRQTRPAVFRAAHKFVSIKEFVCHQLFGCWIVDESIASASGLYHLAQRDWSAAALAAAGVTREQLSAIAAPETVLRGLAAGYVTALNLAADTPFVLGASDGCLANLGAGLLSAGGQRRAVLTIGTSGALRMAAPRPATDAAMRTFCYALSPASNEYVIGGATNGGGLPLRWLRDNFPQLRIGVHGGATPGLPTALQHELSGEPAGDAYRTLAALAGQVPAGANGLLFHPYLAGERAPLWNADARASFIGLTFNHGPAHLVRAVMEGVLFNLAMILDVLEELAGGPVDEIIAGGGFARSDFWLQMAADLFGRPLLVASNPESTAQGAALLALKAMGRVTSLTAAVAQLPSGSRRIVPNDAAHARYRILREVFNAIPATLAPFHSRLAAFQRENV